jgi:feruloyl esterase
MEIRCDRVRRIAFIAASGIGLALGALSPAPAVAASCDAVAQLKIDNTTIDAAELHPAGAYTPAGGAEIAGLPPFCRVGGVVSPVEGSHVGFELWLPEVDWNGKIEMLGNGGYSSAMSFPAMADQLKRGYTAVASDTGHKGDDPDFAAGHPEAIEDWASRAVHVSIDAAKSIVSAFYGQAARHGYFWGGQQALMEAQRHPKDFDGILAGDPGNNRTHLNAGFLWQFVKNHRSSDLSVIVPPEKLALITDAVVKECRGKDGGAASDEFRWSLYWADPAHPDRPARLNFWRIWAFQDPNWDWRTFDFDTGMTTVDDRLASTINAMSSDLSSFHAAGGKLIQYHGLADPVVPPRESIDYYERVQAAEDRAKPPRIDASADFYRLFLPPGLYHCQGGPGPNVVDVQGALEKWVEQDVAPETIAATKYRDDKPAEGVAMSRPLCAYPKRAHYNGSGDPAEASSFSCVEAARYPSPLPAAAYLR